MQMKFFLTSKMTGMETTATIIRQQASFSGVFCEEGHTGGSGNKFCFFESDDLLPLARELDLEF